MTSTLTTTRRGFLAGAAVGAAAAFAPKAFAWGSDTQYATEPVSEAKIAPRTLLGYSSELSVRPGDKIDFYVSDFSGEGFTADLVKVINGDAVSRYREMFQVDPVASSFEGRYAGIKQELELGSYVEIQNPVLPTKSFTVGAYIYPTFNPETYKAPDLENIDPFHPPSLNIGHTIKRQTVVSRRDDKNNTGWALQLNEKNQLVFISEGYEKTIDLKLNTFDWSYVALSYDAISGSFTLFMLETPFSAADKFTARWAKETGTTSISHTGPLRIGATRNGAGNKRDKPHSVFNGRVQDVKFINRALKQKDIELLMQEKSTIKASAHFDFSKAEGHKVIDSANPANKGTIYNLPELAIRGCFSKGSINVNENPEEFNAIKFNADDLYDAEWKRSFSYKIPNDLKSGIYAARLKQGNFVEYITFFVAAAKGKPQAKLAVWMSEYNYLAYSNITLGVTAKKNYPGHNFNDSDLDFLRDNPEFGTGCVYNQHADGLYYIYGSRKRPDIHMKPGGFAYNFVQDTHITAMLEHFDVDYDIITDELIDNEPELLKQYTCIVSSSHPEYVTSQMFDAVESYQAEGGRFMYIGGNGWFWSVGTHPTLPGVMESRNFAPTAERYLTDGRRGGLMIEAGRNTGVTFGNEMSGMIFNGSSSMKKLPDAENPRAKWIFSGCKEGLHFGTYGIDKVRGGCAGFEIDRYNAGNGAPRHALHLADSTPLMHTIEHVKISSVPVNITYEQKECAIDQWAKASVVFFETAKGGAMFSTGSITWISSAPENNWDNDICRITMNVVKRFIDSSPFPLIGDYEKRVVNRLQDNPKYSPLFDPRIESKQQLS